MNHFKRTIKSFADGKISYISHDYMRLCEKYIWSLISDCYALKFYMNLCNYMWHNTNNDNPTINNACENIYIFNIYISKLQK